MPNRLHFACAITLLAIAFPPASRAEDGAWKVGQSYVVRFDKLDLSRPADRQILLAQVERSAAKLCAGQQSPRKREACAKAAVASSIASAPALRTSIEIARLERDGQQQALR